MARLLVNLFADYKSHNFTFFCSFCMLTASHYDGKGEQGKLESGWKSSETTRLPGQRPCTS